MYTWWWLVCVYIYIYMYIYIYIHISLSLYIYIYIYTHTYSNTCMCVCVYLSLSTYIYIYIYVCFPMLIRSLLFVQTYFHSTVKTCANIWYRERLNVCVWRRHVCALKHWSHLGGLLGSKPECQSLHRDSQLEVMLRDKVRLLTSVEACGGPRRPAPRGPPARCRGA